MFARTSLFAAVALAVCCTVGFAADPKPGADSLLGKWYFPKKNGKLEITKDDKGIFNGKVVEYEKPEQIDDKNPDPKLKGRKFVGIEMLQGFKYNGEEEEWSEGTIYDAESGKTYKCTMWFENGDLNKLNVRGYIGLSFLGRTEIFPRVTPEDEKAEQEKAAAAAAEEQAAN